jgi:hypothetical protein
LQNGDAAPEYQSLLLELEALSRALHQLEALKPAKHELIQLDAIRATARTCQRPLEDFLAKISKFESLLGTFSVTNNRIKGFPRRMQFSMVYREDVKQLRSILGSHVATINLLLMTQTMGSITMAENDRERVACGLESKILAHQRLLGEVKTQVNLSLEHQLETKFHLQNHSVALESLGRKADRTNQHLQEQEALMQEAQAIIANTHQQTTSVLTTATDILALVTSGMMNVRLIISQLSRILELYSRFTTDMREAMSRLVLLFSSLHTMIQRIENSLPMRLNLPIVKFTDALGETMALPYQLCQQWGTFRLLLGVIFDNKPGKSRVEMGQFLIMNARGGRLLREASWQHTIQKDDHLSMLIVLDNLRAKNGHCPFPSCQVSIACVEVINGGRTCPECGRWAVMTPRTSGFRLIDLSVSNLSQSTKRKVKSKGDEEGDKETDFDDEAEEEVPFSEEDIELYRQIQVQVLIAGQIKPSANEMPEILKEMKREMDRVRKRSQTSEDAIW